MESHNDNCIDRQTEFSICRQLKDISITSTPLTVDLNLERSFCLDLRQAAMDQKKTVQLTIRGTVTKATGSGSIRLFLNTPSANIKTEPDDPHFVTSLSYFNVTSETGEPFSFTTQLDTVIERLHKIERWDCERKFQLTMFAVAPDNQAVIKNELTYPLKSITLSIDD